LNPGFPIAVLVFFLICKGLHLEKYWWLPYRQIHIRRGGIAMESETGFLVSALRNAVDEECVKLKREYFLCSVIFCKLDKSVRSSENVNYKKQQTDDPSTSRLMVA
jgi:hypothetical protein